MMRVNRMWMICAAGALVLAGGTAMGQGRGWCRGGNGGGCGRGMGYCRAQGGGGAGYGRGMGYGLGQGAGAQGGGWWMRANPRTAEQRALLGEVANLHNRLRNANIAVMDALNADDSARVARCQRDAEGVRAELNRLMTAHADELRQMGMPAWAGRCLTPTNR